jgi:hypothetical protein
MYNYDFICSCVGTGVRNEVAGRQKDECLMGSLIIYTLDQNSLWQ